LYVALPCSLHNFILNLVQATVRFSNSHQMHEGEWGKKWPGWLFHSISCRKTFTGVVTTICKLTIKSAHLAKGGGKKQQLRSLPFRRLLAPVLCPIFVVVQKRLDLARVLHEPRGRYAQILKGWIRAQVPIQEAQLVGIGFRDPFAPVILFDHRFEPLVPILLVVLHSKKPDLKVSPETPRTAALACWSDELTCHSISL